MSLNFEVFIFVFLYVLFMYREFNLFFIGFLVNKNICNIIMYFLMLIVFNVIFELFIL